jgi:manganese-dependent inorganic pyrophosphatase
MNTYYVLGHKNPDTDSICAAYTYAWFKSKLNPLDKFIPGICGTPNETTEYVFSRFGIEIPELIIDLHPRVSDVMLTDLITIDENEPILSAIEKFEEGHIRTLPVQTNDGLYRGVLSIWEMSDFFMPKDFANRPRYMFRPDNFAKVLPGEMLRQGSVAEFETTLMVGAMQFDTFLNRLHKVVSKDGEQANYPVLVVGDRKDIIEYALKQPFPAIILTGIDPSYKLTCDFNTYQGWLFVSETDTAETIRILRTSVPVKAIANIDVPILARTDYLKKAKENLRNSYYRGLPVVEDNRLIGLVNTSSLVDPPRKKVILVDHNEFSQSVEGIENTELCEIIDHHRIGMIKTTNPIYIYAKPLGSTCTLIYQHFISYQIEITAPIASILLAGILADTVILRSPTTTKEDSKAVEHLSILAGLDFNDFGRDLFSHISNLSNLDPELVINEDMKIYTEHGLRFGIAQVEVITFSDLEEVVANYRSALDKCKYEHQLQWLMLLVTNILEEDSYLLMSALPETEKYLAYSKMQPQLYHLPGILSRKKQLLPEIIRVVEKWYKESQF